MKSKPKEGISWLYDGINDVQSMVDISDSLLNKLNIDMKIIIITSKEDVVNLFSTRKFLDYSYSIKNVTEGLDVINLKRALGREKKEVLRGRFLLIRHERPDVFLIITHVQSKFLKKGIDPFLKKYYPKISRVHIDSNQMKKYLEDLEESLPNMKIRINRVSSKSRLVSKGARKRIESEVKWTDIPFQEIFYKAYENDEWIENIDFELLSADLLSSKSNYISFSSSPSSKPINCHLSRRGIFKCNHHLSKFYNSIIDDIALNASNRVRFFNNRHRKKEEGLKPKPIVIEYDFEVFKDKSQNERLLSALRKNTYSSVSVYHSNPYFHSSFVDYRDGSSCDIWVLSNKRIIIVPQMRSTYASLLRLCSSIFTGFREGIIRDYSEVEYD